MLVSTGQSKVRWGVLIVIIIVGRLCFPLTMLSSVRCLNSVGMPLSPLSRSQILQGLLLNSTTTFQPILSYFWHDLYCVCFIPGRDPHTHQFFLPEKTSFPFIALKHLCFTIPSQGSSSPSGRRGITTLLCSKKLHPYCVQDHPDKVVSRR